MSETAVLEAPSAVAEMPKNGSRGPIELPNFHREHRWTRAEYRQLTKTGVFDGKKVELIDGKIIENMAAMLGPHATGISNLTHLFPIALVGRPFVIRIQLPIAIGEITEPEPDLCIARGGRNDYFDDHPTPEDIVLLVEVSDATLRYDRREKMSLYAKSGIAEYWILNVVGQQLEVFRQPAPDAEQPFGFGYALRQIVAETGHIAPLFAPQNEFAVADLLPRATEESN